MKKLVTISLLFFSVGAINAYWDGDASSWTEGEGTETNPYLIQKEEHLAYLQQTVNEGEGYEGKYFLLTTNLDMDGKTFNPIGFYDDYSLDNVWVEDSKPFLGTFDGGYNTIDNVTIELAEEDPYEIGGIGLFAVGRQSTCIKNLKLGSNVTVNAKGSPDIGGILGYGEGSTIENCSFAGTINGGPTETGGIIGRGEKGLTISGCINSGNVIGNSFTGGIAGSIDNSTIINCLHDGTVNGNFGYWVSGIVSWALNSSVKSSVSIGSIIGEKGSIYMPGISPICSELEKSTATNCFYVEELTGCKPLMSQSGVIAVSAEEIKSEEILVKLNGENEESPWILSEETGYPTLDWTLNMGGAGVNVVLTEKDNCIKISNGTVKITAIEGQYTILDLSGKTVEKGYVNGTIELNPVYKGIFVIVVRSADGSSSTAKICF